MKRFKANGASLMSDFHRTSPEISWLRLCRIKNESTETENCYESLSRELRWLCNSVYKYGLSGAKLHGRLRMVLFQEGATCLFMFIFLHLFKQLICLA